MKYILMCVLLLSSVLFGTRAFAETATSCVSDPIPTGWVATDQFYDLGECNTPYPPLPFQGNVLTITRYNNLPVGSILNVCSADYTPIPGWNAGPWHYDGTICDCPYPTCTAFANNVYTITHATCAAGQTNCYPPSGTITASPSSLTVPYHGSGTTYVTYSSQNTSGVCVWVSETNATPVLWRCGGNASNVPWIYVPWGGTSKFYLSTSNTSWTPTLSTFTVTGIAGAQPTFSINPTHVIVPAGQTSGTFTMNWNAPGYPSLDLWGKINSDPWHFGLSIGASGNTGDNIAVGTTYSYDFYAPGSPGPLSSTPNQGLLGTLTTYASH